MNRSMYERPSVRLSEEDLREAARIGIKICAYLRIYYDFRSSLNLQKDASFKRKEDQLNTEEHE